MGGKGKANDYHEDVWSLDLFDGIDSEDYLSLLTRYYIKH